MQNWEKPQADPELKRRIQELITYKGGGHNPDLVADIIENALKLLTDVEPRGDVRVIQTAVRELRYAFKLFAPHADVRKVTIFGSARTAPSKQEYQQAVDFARKIADAGWMVITGAGPGIMQAGHEGAGPERSFGANIRLPWEQSANPVIQHDKKLMDFHFFFTRKLMFVKEADAVVIFPGGFGTHDELLESITLAQTGKTQLVPIVLMDLPDGTYWTRWQEFLRDNVMSRGYITEREMTFFRICTSAEAAVKEITKFYRNFHSYRFVKKDLVIRLNHPPTAELIDRLNRDFADIVTGGKVRQSAPLPAEAEDPDKLHLHRLVMRFNREDYARLRQMIDVINEEGSG